MEGAAGPVATTSGLPQLDQVTSDIGGPESRPIGRLTTRRLMALVAILALPMLVWREFERGQEAARESDCRSQLTQYGLALRIYEGTYGGFPPASAIDGTGLPAHSWRVAILADWEDHSVSGRYDFAVPWDHPNNAPLVSYDTRSFFYWCPSGDGRRTHETDYVAVVGPHTAWPEGRGLRLAEIADDPASTILWIEVADSGIHWMKPGDITLDRLLSKGPSSHHPGHFNALFADGRVRRIRKDVDRATLRALLTIDGGETIDPDSW
jgi:prepilin-type processing-associated H-X9-DG protein